MLLRVFLVVCFVCVVAGSDVSGPAAPESLHVNGVSVKSPLTVAADDSFTLTFATRHSQRGAVQSALRCVVSAGPQPSLSSLLWDSGVVETKDSVAVYTGPVLPSARTLFVAVSWRDSKGVFSPLSQWAVLRTAPAASAWAASSWIGKGFGMMRKTFMMSASRHSSSSSSSSSSPPVVAHVAGIGFHQLYVNGQRVSMDTPLAGDWTVWNTRVVYHSYDISSFLTPGAKNTIGVTLGHGWRNTTSFPYHFNASACADPLQRLLRMVVVADGDTTPMVATDDSWSGSSAGHVVFDSVYDGETHDMRKAQPTWSTPSFVPGSDWMGTVTVPTDCFDPTLTPLSIAPISIQAVRPALSVSRINATVQVVDFGDNLSGWARIRAQLPAGHAVEVRHAEVLMHEPYGPADGTVYTGNLRSAKATDVYIGAGDKEAQWYEPEGFTYHGFRYVQVTGYPGDLQLSDIQQVHFRTATRLQVALSTASNLLDRIQYGVAWGQGSNQMSVPTDCDQRDERLGWMGDAGLSADSFAINYDYSAFRANFLRAITDDQNGTTGSLPDVVPYQRYGNMPADPSWSAAYPQNIYVAYAVDNELAPARMYWDNLMHYFGNMAWQLQKAGGDMKNMSASYGDWVPADPTTKVDNSLPAAMNYVINVRQAAELAVALGKASDAANLTMWANTLVSDFNTAFKTQTPHGACWDMCGQAGYSMAYMAGAVDVTTDTNFTTQLVDDITHRYSNHPSSGIIGIKAMFPTLQTLGQQQVALNLLQQTSEPSYGYMFLNDLEPANSSIWELWDAPTEGPGMNSRNHHMFSSVSTWIVRHVGGLSSGGPTAVSCYAAPAVPLHLRAADVLGVSHSTLDVDARCGRVALSYRRHGGLQCTVHPEGASSTRQRAPAVPDAQLSCGDLGGVISSVDFASWGTAGGGCSSFTASRSCHHPASMDVVKARCLGRASCVVPTHADFWMAQPGADAVVACGADPSTVRSLSVQVTCSLPHAVTATVTVPPSTTAAVHLPTYGHTAFSVKEVVSGATLVSPASTTATSTPEGVLGAYVEDGAPHPHTGHSVRVDVVGGTYSFVLQ